VVSGTTHSFKKCVEIQPRKFARKFRSRQHSTVLAAACRSSLQQQHKRSSSSEVCPLSEAFLIFYSQAPQPWAQLLSDLLLLILQLQLLTDHLIQSLKDSKSMQSMAAYSNLRWWLKPTMQFQCVVINPL
jgi:hypothetical protein